ncbi:hypothetical protein CASFOL_022269 [Castilleja foliolosa]|uniref:GAG-pre-integrase domain-containing protein n=1 Tax=Castilleja foliolosa TaxID=1961234 RepID=A0ABD3CV45_9LAMI
MRRFGRIGEFKVHPDRRRAATPFLDRTPPIAADVSRRSASPLVDRQQLVPMPPAPSDSFLGPTPPLTTASISDHDSLSDDGYLLRFGDFPSATYDIDGLVIEFGTHGFDELDDPSPTYSTTPKGPFVEMSKNPLSSILDQNRLTGSNYQDWIRSLKLVLTLDDLVYVLTEVPPDSLPPTATEADLAKLAKWKKDDVTARCYMIASMIPEMQRKYETFEHASDIARHLESCYSENMRASTYAATRELVTMRLREGASVHEHGLKMMTLLEKLVKLEVVLPHQLSTDLILLSLPSSYEPFIVNFNMNKLEPPMDELLNMLVSFESTMRKEKPVLLVGPGRKSPSPKKRKSFALGKRFEKGDSSGVKKDKVSKQVADVCHFCGKAGHWRATVLLTSIRSVLIPLMTRSRRLEVGETYLRMGNGARVAAEAIGTVYISIYDSSYSVVLNNCLYVPTLIRNLISIPVLDNKGFTFVFGNSICIIQKGDDVVCKGQLVNNLYELNPRDVPVNTITAKRKINGQNPAQLWHARLGHISLRRMNECARDGLFSLEDMKSFEPCESCLKGRMAKSPFKCTMQRVEGLLDLIHTDVCGPLSVSARGGFFRVDDRQANLWLWFEPYLYETII